MTIKSKVILILNKKFNFFGNDNDIIYNNLDSVTYYKLLLTLEDEFKIHFENKDISTINNITHIINENYKI
jgi:acyl carrier protein